MSGNVDQYLFTFNRIDDVVKVFIENSANDGSSPVFTGDLLLTSATTGPRTFDLTPHLLPGTNTVRVQAKNNLGQASLFGDLKKNDVVIEDWAVVKQGNHQIDDPDHIFVNDTIEIEVEGEEISSHIDLGSYDDHVMIDFNRVVGNVTVKLNDQPVQPYSSTVLQFTLHTPHLKAGNNTLHVQAVSGAGPGMATLQGSFKGDSNVVHTWNIQKPGHPPNTIFLDETYVFGFYGYIPS